ncbi:MAG: hypothetical protein QOJ40_1633 [Verrucomicrobiota bacterium]
MLASAPLPHTDPEMTHGSSGWGRFFTQIQKDLKLWLFALGYLWLFRLLMIFLFRGELGQSSSWLDMVRCSARGFRFDASIATYWVLVPVAMSMACAFRDFTPVANRIRVWVGIVFLVLSSVLCMAAFGFFQEYHDQFNHWIFGLVADNYQVIVRTIWSEHHPILDLLGVGVGAALAGFFLKKMLRRPFFMIPETRSAMAGNIWLKALVIALVCFGIFVGARGSLGSRPLQLKDTAVTQDDVLNKLVVNPYYALKYALSAHRMLQRASGLRTFLPDGRIGAAARLAFPGSANFQDLDECLVKIAKGTPGKPPSHIFLVLMESFDGWTMMDQYQSMGLTPRLKQLAKDGIFIKSFVSSGDGTMPSLSTLVTGLPFVGVFANYQSSSQHPFPCSTASIFKRLGYTTRFFYGGYVSWLRVGDFCRSQGFDEVYGAGHMQPGGIGSDWRVQDEDLFRFIAKTVADDKPSFNLVLSTSDHPPYGLDVYGMGFPLHEIPPDLKDRYNGRVALKTFGHLWYADRSLGEFVTTLEPKLTAPLFAITGDHWSRKFVNDKPTLFERTAVPCVLYGKNVLAGVTAPAGLAGAHIDIVPTLVELAAPAGFKYHSFGGNLLDAQRPPIGFGLSTVIGPNFIFDVKDPSRIEFFSEAASGQPVPSIESLQHLHEATHGLAWWRAMKGSELPLED